MKNIALIKVVFFTSLLQSFMYWGVPENIQNAFQQQYPNALDIEWDIQGIYYHVEFETRRDMDHDIWYNENGEEIKHKSEIRAKELPQQILNALKESYPLYHIDEVDKIIEMGETFYDIELENALGSEIEMMIKENGEIISQYPD